MSSPLLSVQQLSAAIIETNQSVLNRISFDIFPGETLALVGESGSGKSLTALSIPRLLPEKVIQYTDGSIFFKGRNGERVDLLRLSKQKINQYRGKEIGLVFQEPMSSLNPLMTCGKQVMEQILQHSSSTPKQAKEKTIELFHQVELPDPEKMINRYPHQLSGGQKQRVMIAMAISCNPSLLIADEPTTALDVSVQKSILSLLNKIRVNNGMAMLFITHDLGIVEEIADKVIVMHKGEIKESRSTKELMKDPAHPYTKALLACRSTSFQKGQILPTVESIMQGEDNTKPSIKQAHSSPILPAFSKTEKQPFLQVKNLSVTLSEKKWWSQKKEAGKPILRGVSFNLFQGETVGLVGESGCGKTTLGRTLLQLQPASSGRIDYKGRNLISLSRHQFNPYRKEMQIVFQDPYASLNPRMRIGQILLEPLQLHQRPLSHREAQKKILQLLEKVGLPPDAIHRFPHAFSGGQRQRICIARALAVNPSFIVWDESVSALDASIQAQILNLINQLKQEWGFSSLFISHDLSVVRYLCDRILIMKNGEIVEQGDADTIWENPSHPYTKELLAAIPGKQFESNVNSG